MVADSTASPEAVNLVGTTILGPSPNTVHYINAQSYQQDALLTYGGEQEAAEPAFGLLPSYFQVGSTLVAGKTWPAVQYQCGTSILAEDDSLRWFGSSSSS